MARREDSAEGRGAVGLMCRWGPVQGAVATWPFY